MIHLFIYRFDSDCDNEWLRCFEYSEVIKKAASLFYIEKPLLIKKHENGKPYFVYADDGGSPQACFSISHSDNVLILALSDMNIGIDIEYVRKKHDGIIGKWFSDSEKQYVFEGKSDDEQNERYYEVWTKKEACVKYSGTGIDKNFKRVDVFDDNLADRLKTFYYEGFIVSIRTLISNETVMLYTPEGKKVAF